MQTQLENEFHVEFYKYIPKKISFLSDLIIIIFNSLPRKLEPFLLELHAELNNTTSKYEYTKEFSFDLFNDDLAALFEYQIYQRGQKYYNENKVKFLEKLDIRYFAVVEGQELYVVIVDYNPEEKKTKVYCSCPCEFYCKHICAVITSIRNNKYNKFYKVTYKNPNADMLDRMMNFQFYFCLGTIEEYLIIINNQGLIEYAPILNENKKNYWGVLEDDQNDTLTKEIKKITKKG